MKINEDNLGKIIDELILYINEKISNGTEICLMELLDKKYKFVNIEKVMDSEGIITLERDYVYENITIPDKLLLKMMHPLILKAKEKNIELDFSKYDDQDVGLPYNIPFIIKKN